MTPARTCHEFGDASAVFDRLRRLGAATIHEALGRVGAVDPAVKPLDPRTRLVGPAFTVDAAPADNLAVQQAVTLARPGDVLVIDAKGYLDAGLWGDVLTHYALRAGIAGIVVDGAVRDSHEIIRLGFPVFTRGTCIKGTDKHNPGRINVPVMFAGTPVSPGDIIVGDCDGIMVVPAAELDRAVTLGELRAAEENHMRERITAGARLIDLLGLPDRRSAR